jgi:flagellar hook assembly protein FlgD
LSGLTPNTPMNTSFSVIATDGELSDTLKVSLIIKEQNYVVTQKNIPQSYLFYPNYPNPFNPITNIKIGVPSKTDLSISIYNINGRIVDTIFKGKLDPGYHNFIWYAMNIPSGTYFIKYQTKDISKISKCLFLK